MGDANEVMTFLQQNGSVIALVLGTTAVGVILCWYPMQVFIRGIRMKQQRREGMQRWAADKFTDIIEDGIKDGEFTREEANDELYRPLKCAFPVKDLFPTDTLLKERITKRMTSGTHAPVTLPTLVVVRKHLFDKG